MVLINENNQRWG